MDIINEIERSLAKRIVIFSQDVDKLVICALGQNKGGE